jgi:hypothetical protein
MQIKIENLQPKEIKVQKNTKVLRGNCQIDENVKHDEMLNDDKIGDAKASPHYHNANGTLQSLVIFQQIHFTTYLAFSITTLSHSHQIFKGM